MPFLQGQALDILSSIRILMSIIVASMPLGDSRMTTITQSVTVNRPVEEVWTFISNFENTTRWSRGVLEARQTSDGPLGVGSTLQTVVKAFGRRRTADYLVTEYKPNHAFAFKVTSGPMTSRARYSVEPVGTGTRLTASGEAEATGLYKLLAPLLVRILKRHSQDDLANVKRILDATVRPPGSSGGVSPGRR
jgi:carbon monoxide dehydrogenase subunit G